MKKYVTFVFFLTLILRLYFALQTPYFDYGDAYLNLARIETIQENAIPIFDDPFSFSGIRVIFLPLFHYLMSIFASFMPIVLASKLFPNILASLVVFIIYYIVHHITRNKMASFLSSAMAGFLPIYFVSSFNSISIMSFTIPLFFLGIYFLMKHNDKRYIFYYVICFILLSLTSPISLLFVLVLLIYIIMLKVASIKEDLSVFELIIFSSFFSLWLNILFFKDLLHNLGFGIFWRNIPATILTQYFSNLNLAHVLVQIGLIPILFGMYSIYSQMFDHKKKDVYLIMSVVLTCLLFLWLKLITLTIGLIILGYGLIILTGVIFSNILKYFNDMKFFRYYNLFIFGIIFLIVFSLVIPSLIYASNTHKPEKFDVDGFLWLRDNIDDNSIVLGNLDEGYLISSIAKKKNVYDRNFMFAKNIDSHISDVKDIYNSQYLTDVLFNVEKYKIDYIILSDLTKQQYNITNLASYTKDCFETVYNESLTIYKVKCKVTQD